MNTATPTNVTFVTQKDLAKRYAVSVAAVSKWASSGRIPCIRIGKSVRFDLAAVIAAIEGPK